jgi:hypothetical protein
MAKPLDAQSDQELEKALADGSLDVRKEAIAKEILSRRWQTKSEAIKTNYGWLGGVLVALALTVAAVRRVLWAMITRRDPPNSEFPRWKSRGQKPGFLLKRNE